MPTATLGGQINAAVKDIITTTLLETKRGYSRFAPPSIEEYLARRYAPADISTIFADGIRHLVIPALGEHLKCPVKDEKSEVAEPTRSELMLRQLHLPERAVVPFHKNPHKDKVFTLTSGRTAIVVLHDDDLGIQDIHWIGRGQSIVVPRGIWHAIDSLVAEESEAKSPAVFTIVGSSQANDVIWEPRVVALRAEGLIPDTTKA